ncbi:hypothetical protein FBR04_19930 [Betaproteobacteria bacterium PRO7]|jgi:hypothetical protein|nr:hypothetical protein [Betaproteobacteria bacterium PRO7]
MTRDIPFDAAQDVRAIAYRLAPIDVGFDLRGEGIPVQVRAIDDPIRVSYADAQGQRRVIEGPQRDVLRALEAQGYRFVIVDGGQS